MLIISRKNQTIRWYRCYEKAFVAYIHLVMVAWYMMVAAEWIRREEELLGGAEFLFINNFPNWTKYYGATHVCVVKCDDTDTEQDRNSSWNLTYLLHYTAMCAADAKIIVHFLRVVMEKPWLFGSETGKLDRCWLHDEKRGSGVIRWEGLWARVEIWGLMWVC